MPLDRFHLLDYVTNLLQVYMVYKFLKVFFTNRKTSPTTEKITYLIYYIVVVITAIYVKIPIVNVIVCLTSFYLLSLNYKGTIKSRVMAVLSMYVTMTCVELVVVMFTGYFSFTNVFEKTAYSNVLGNVACKLMCFMVVLLVENYSHIKSGVNIPTSSWLSILFIPVGTFYIIASLLLSGIEQAYIVVAGVLILLGINIITFYLYDALSAFFEEKLSKELLKQQNEYYVKQIEIMNSSYENVRSVRHDIKNHLIALDTFVRQENCEKATEYISQLVDAAYGEKSVVSTGNIDIDSILNYKIEQAKAKKIDVNLDVSIPNELEMATLDIVSILGNLIDNAINANMKLEEGRRIVLSLKYSKGIFFITISNTYDGYVAYTDDKIATTNKDKNNHGIGLNNIYNIIEKYDGTIKITHDEKIFKVSILLYLN